MASVATPYGLRPINLIGGQSYSGSNFREYFLPSTSFGSLPTAGVNVGDVIQLTAGVPLPVTATPTVGTTHGVVGVCVGVRYYLPQPINTAIFGQAFTNQTVGTAQDGRTGVWIRVVDDPDQLYMVQASGTVTSASIGKNAGLTNFPAAALVNGVTTVQLNQASIAATATLALSIVDLVNQQTYQFVGTTVGSLNYPQPGDAFTDCIVKFNFGLHRYYDATGN
jgi:hypothetical protein